ncbi:hypothetical protein [Amycolatopsis antarctica]|nr:hypothetical protein [Amycolatopsis antarctica]
MPDEPVTPGEIAHALRRVRPSVYRIGEGADPTLALVMNAGPAGRRNAAAKIAGLLAEHGLTLGTGDDIAALTEDDGALPVRRSAG